MVVLNDLDKAGDSPATGRRRIEVLAPYRPLWGCEIKAAEVSSGSVAASNDR